MWVASRERAMGEAHVRGWSRLYDVTELDRILMVQMAEVTPKGLSLLGASAPAQFVLT
jgi:hypothetical protein